MTTAPPTRTPTKAQLELIEQDGSRVVEACPGSGKTWSIVARFQRQTEQRSRRGIALVSFTNAAVDEVVQRCSDATVLAPPNFVGTFDSFLNRFVSGPYLANRFRRYPRFVDSWRSIRAASFGFDGLADGLAFNLDQFDWNAGGRYAFDARRATGQWGPALRKTYEKNAAAINAFAEKRRRTLIQDSGIIASSASRRLASILLQGTDSQGEIWRQLLGGRFRELIVDETQDCGGEELSVLRAVLTAGIDVVAVADIDQSIFEFRHAEPKLVRAFADDIGRGTRLDGNFRSSPAILQLGGRLRLSQHSDKALGPERENSLPVQAVTFDLVTEVAPKVDALLSGLGIPTGSCIVLAHRRDHAALCANAPSSFGDSARAAMVIARAHRTLNDTSDPSDRRAALDRVELTLLRLAGFKTDGGAKEEILKEMGTTRRWLRDAATRLSLGSDPSIMDRRAYALRLRDVVRNLEWPSPITLENLGQRLATPPASDWNELAIGQATALRWSTIHGAKGKEYDAVALVLPQKLVADDDGRTCLDLWEQGIDGESRRVLYVGATRARRALILVVHSDHRSRVQELAGPDSIAAWS